MKKLIPWHKNPVIDFLWAFGFGGWYMIDDNKEEETP